MSGMHSPTTTTKLIFCAQLLLMTCLIILNGIIQRLKRWIKIKATITTRCTHSAHFVIAIFWFDNLNEKFTFRKYMCADCRPHAGSVVIVQLKNHLSVNRLVSTESKELLMNSNSLIRFVILILYFRYKCSIS